MGSSRSRIACRLAITLAALLLLTVACNRAVEIRSYQEVTVAPTPVGVLFDSTGAEVRGERSQDAGEWRWVTPSEWSDLPGDGLRLARFGIPGGGESTVVVLSGDAGGVEANVRRWLKQLGLELPQSGFQKLIDEAVRIHSNFDFTFFDFTPLVRSPSDIAFLTAIATVDGQTMFVKAEAQNAVLTEQREAFIGLLRSLRPGSPVSSYGN